MSQYCIDKEFHFTLLQVPTRVQARLELKEAIYLITEAYENHNQNTKHQVKESNKTKGQYDLRLRHHRADRWTPCDLQL